MARKPAPARLEREVASYLADVRPAPRRRARPEPHEPGDACTCGCRYREHAHDSPYPCIGRGGWCECPKFRKR